MSSSIVMRVARSRAINSNDRLHWADKASRTKQVRWEAQLRCRADSLVKSKRAKVDVYVATPRRGGDVGNWYPTVKAIIDGMVDYGFLPDDRDEYLLGPFLHRAAERSPRGAVDFRVEVTPLEA